MTRTIDEIVDIFIGLGYRVAEDAKVRMPMALAVVVAGTPLLPFAGSTRVTVSGAVVNVVVVRASGAPAQVWIPEESVRL